MQNHNSKLYITNSLYLLGIILFGLFLIFSPLAADAHVGIPKQLVPCGTDGNPCNICHLYTLAHNVIDFLLWGLATPLLVIAILVGGIYWLTSGGSEQRIERGKEILTSAILGFLIAFGAWIIINTIMDTLGGSPLKGTAWNDTSFCSSAPFVTDNTGAIKYSPDKTNLAIDQGNYFDGIDTSGEYFKAQLKEALSQEISGFPPQYNAQIDTRYGSVIDSTAAKYGVDPALMRAIIQAESSGNPIATHKDQDGKSSYGLSQIRPDTAKLLDSSNNSLTDSQIAQRLFDPAYNIDMQGRYLGQLSKKYSGPALQAAAYNGGPGANGPSRDCPGKLRWQCEYDNPQHTVPNTGYKVTRDYTQKVTTLAESLRK